jgi:hypothetical protein
MPDHFNWPWFIHVLVDIDDSRADQRKSINRGHQHQTLFRNANSIHTAFGKLLSHAFADSVLCPLPNVLPQFKSTILHTFVFNINNVSWGVPMVCVGIPFANSITGEREECIEQQPHDGGTKSSNCPLLNVFLIPAVPVPKLFDKLEDRFRSPHFGVPQLYIITHTLMQTIARNDTKSSFHLFVTGRKDVYSIYPPLAVSTVF